MSESEHQSANTAAMLERRVPSWLLSGGLRSLMIIAIVAAVAVGFQIVSITASLVVPMVIAGVLGALFAPVVIWLTERRVPPIVGATLVILFLTFVVLITVQITVKGVVQQAPEIQDQIQASVATISDALTDAGLKTPSKESAADQVESSGNKLIDGAFGNVLSIFSGIGSLLFGCFILLFLLFYALIDWQRFEVWMGSRMGVPSDIGYGIVKDATHAIRLYFGGLTISSIIVAIVIGMTMYVLELPLAFTVAVVTFVTAYIPYVGAILSGAFAFLVALSGGGLAVAVTVLVVVLISQNVIQAIVQTKVTSAGLEVHPALNFASAILGAIVAGAIGAILAPPVVATSLRTLRVLKSYYTERETA